MLFGMFGRKGGFVLSRLFDNEEGVLLISIGLFLGELGLGRKFRILA